MKNVSLPIKLLYLLAGLTIFTIIMFALLGENGLIQRERDNYNETHMEEREEGENEVVVRK